MMIKDEQDITKIWMYRWVLRSIIPTNRELKYEEIVLE